MVLTHEYEKAWLKAKKKVEAMEAAMQAKAIQKAKEDPACPASVVEAMEEQYPALAEWKVNPLPEPAEPDGSPSTFDVKPATSWDTASSEQIISDLVKWKNLAKQVTVDTTTPSPLMQAAQKSPYFDGETYGPVGYAPVYPPYKPPSSVIYEVADVLKDDEPETLAEEDALYVMKVRPDGNSPVSVGYVEKVPVKAEVLSKSYAVCDGRVLLTEDYPELFAAIGYKYGGSVGFMYLPNYLVNPPKAQKPMWTTLTAPINMSIYTSPTGGTAFPLIPATAQNITYTFNTGAITSTSA